MIQSKEDLYHYLKQDRIMNWADGKVDLIHAIKNVILPNKRLRYLRILRKAEYYTNNNNVLQYWYQYRLLRLGLRLGYSIPINVFGPGLSLPHYGTIIVHINSKIGSNCRLHACVNIGAKGGKAPTLGDNVYIGPSAVVFGDIHIADNITIGANATVNKSFNVENVAIAGSPAHVIKENVPSWVERHNLD
ncbi:MAG: serine acetyltransferase [Bacteroidales bacterium]|nr:serine acetyltransferase [Bacteroidales bacterium]